MQDQVYKWAEISKKKSERYQVLSEFLNSQGIKNEFQYFSTENQNLEDLINEVKKTTKSIRFGSELWDQLNPYVNQTYTDALRIKSIDALYFDEKDGWWPHLSFDEAFSYYLSEFEKGLITRDPVFVIGSGGLARSVVNGLIKIGYAKINIASENEKEALEIQKDFGAIFFNSTFSNTARDSVTLLPGVHNIVVNTYGFPEKDEFLRDLYFFNFLKKNGIVVDLNEVPLDTPLIQIAQDINAKVIQGAKVLVYSDYLWARIAFKKDFVLKEYEDKVIQHLQGIKVAEDIIKNILEEFQIKT